MSHWFLGRIRNGLLKLSWCDNANLVSTQTIVLPISTKLTDNDLTFITDNFINILREKLFGKLNVNDNFRECT